MRTRETGAGATARGPGFAVLAAAMVVVFVPYGVSAQLVDRCFDSQLEPWAPIEGTHTLDTEPRDPPSAEYDTQLFPPRLLFDGRPIDRAPEWRRIEIPEGALPVPRRYRSWKLDGDTLRLALTDGLSGVRGWFVEAAGVWQGTLETVTDHGGSQRFRRDARLVGADCGSPPPVPASSDPPAPRTVPAIDGPSLSVGRRVPDVYTLDPDPRVGAGGWLMGFEPAGDWGGAERILVTLGVDSLVARFEMRYAEGFDTGALARHLVAEFGPGRPDAPWLTWSNHSTRSFFQESGSPRVVFIDTTLGR